MEEEYSVKEVDMSTTELLIYLSLVIFAVLFFVFLIKAYASRFIFLACSIILNGIMGFGKRQFAFLTRFMPLGIEFILFPTVIASVVWGSGFGIFVGLSSALVSYVIKAYISIFSIVIIPMYGLVGILAAMFSNVNILLLGITLTIIYNFFVSSMLMVMFGAKPYKCWFFGITNLVFNMLLFSQFGQMLINTLK